MVAEVPSDRTKISATTRGGSRPPRPGLGGLLPVCYPATAPPLVKCPWSTSLRGGPVMRTTGVLLGLLLTAGLPRAQAQDAAGPLPPLHTAVQKGDVAEV